MQDNSFDKNIKRKLEGLDIQPSQKVWASVEKELDKKKRRYFFLWLLLPLLIVGGAVFMFSARQQKNHKGTGIVQTQITGIGTSKKEKKENPAPAQGNDQQKIPGQPADAADRAGNTDNKTNIKHRIKTIAGKSKMNITPAFADEDDMADHSANVKQVEGRTSIIITAAAPEELKAEATGRDVPVADTISVASDRNPFGDKEQIALATIKQAEESNTVVADTSNSLRNNIEKMKKQSSARWKDQWGVGGGIARLGTLSIGRAGEKALNSDVSVSNPNMGNNLRTSNNYTFENGMYMNAMLLLNKKLTRKTILITGVQYNFQHIAVTRKYIIDTIAFNTTPSYTNLSTTTYKEELDVHAIDIPLLVKFSVLPKISLSTGFFNRLQFSSQWKNYENVLGEKNTYLPLFHLNPEYNCSNFSFGPVINIGLTQYNNGSRLLNFGLSVKYSPKK